MGTVYAATLEREAAGMEPGTRVALKVVHPHLLGTEGFFKRFLREAQIGRSVLHDNVVRTSSSCWASDWWPRSRSRVAGRRGPALARLEGGAGRVPILCLSHLPWGAAGFPRHP